MIQSKYMPKFFLLVMHTNDDDCDLFSFNSLAAAIDYIRVEELTDWQLSDYEFDGYQTDDYTFVGELGLKK